MFAVWSPAIVGKIEGVKYCVDGASSHWVEDVVKTDWDGTDKHVKQDVDGVEGMFYMAHLGYQEI